MGWKTENGKHVTDWYEAFKCSKCKHIDHHWASVCGSCGERGTLKGIVARQVDTTSLWDVVCMRTSRHWEEK